ncbi:MAG: hypothetical protein IT204_05060 [Fimbriimonadaceae bacterium]|nr:hypothetical protein [Fimbriimonadaceae bacterium]
MHKVLSATRGGLLLWIGVLTTPVLGRLAGDTSFEVGGAGLLLHSGSALPQPQLASVAFGGADGRWAARLAARGADGPALEVPWTAVAGHFPQTLSAWLRSDPAGVRAVLTAHGPSGLLTRQEFTLSRDWRRYTCPAPAGPAWLWWRIAAGSESGTLWVDGLRLDAGEATDYEATAALGVVPPGRRLRRAGEGCRCDLLLRVPGGRAQQLVRWRLEDAAGHLALRGEATVDVPASGRLQWPVTLPALRPGAWRLVATAPGPGPPLTAQTTFVTVAPDLAPPVPWLGFREAAGKAGLEALRSVGAGLHETVWDSSQAPSPALLLRLADERRQGLTSLARLGAAASWPELAAAWQAARLRSGDRLRVWLGPPTETLPPPGLPPETAPTLWWPAVSTAQSLAELQAHLAPWPATAPARLRLAPGPPEAGALPALAQQPATRPWLVEVPATPAECWDTNWPLGPTAATTAVVTARTQAAWAVRAVLLARALGGNALLAAAPAADRPAALRVAASGHGELFGPDGAPQPAVAALEQAVEQLRGRASLHLLRLPHDVYLLLGNRPAWAALWTARPATQRLRLPAAEAWQATDLYGRRVTLYGAPPQVRVGFEPLYLTARGIAPAAWEQLWAARAAAAATDPEHPTAAVP